MRMPPTFTDEGLRAALVVRGRWPDVGVLVLSQYVEERYATELFAGAADGVGYLLKDRVADVAEFLDALRPGGGRRQRARPGGRRPAAGPQPPRPTPSSTCGCAALASFEEFEIRTEDKNLRAELKGVKVILASEAEQWTRVGEQVRKVRDMFGPKTPLGKRRTQFADAPEHDLAAIEEAFVEREPVTVVVSEKCWVRTLKGHVADLAGLTFKTDDKLDQAFFAETTSKLLLFATNGKFYSLDVAKLPGGRGHGDPIRMFIDMDQDAAIVSLFVNTGGRKFLVAQP